VLVDQHVPEAAAVVLGDLRVVLQQGDGLADQVVEVHRVGPAQPGLVLGVDAGDHGGQLGLATGGGVGGRLLGVDQLVLEVGDGGGQQPRGVLLGVEVEIAADRKSVV